MPEYNDSIEKARQTLLVGASVRRWICEVHREIYDLIESKLTGDDRERGLDLTAEAYWYGKKMSDRLKELNDQPDKDTPENPNFQDDLERRSQRLNLLRNIHSVNIETIDWCNRKCDWCPNKDRKTSPDNLMDEQVLVRIIRQLMDNGYRGEIHPFLNGEPTMDKRLASIVKTIKDHLPHCHVKIVTNGDGFKSQSDFEILFQSGADAIHMNHYDGPYAGIRKARDSLFQNLSHFGMEYLRPNFYNRAGKVDYKPETQFDKCEWFLHKLVFNYKGDMVLCCSDFNSEVVFGNIMEQPLSMIMSSPMYRQYYEAHKKGKARHLPLCRECNRIK